MSKYFRPYEGSRPYLFISYSHRNSDTVLDTITILKDRKVRLWYDEGIPAGADWSKNIEEHMQGCAMVLFFVSETALGSPNCRSELEAALSLNKPVLLMPLHSIHPDASWKALLDRCTMLSMCADAASRAETVMNCKRLTRAFYRKPFEHFRFDLVALVLALLLFAAAGSGLYALTTGRLDRYLEGDPTPKPTLRATPTAVITPTPTDTPEPTATPYVPGMDKVTFPDNVQARAVRKALRKSDADEVLLGELWEISALHICGSMVLDHLNDVVYTDGAYTVNTAKPPLGPIEDLSVIGRCYRLETLSLMLQPLTSLADTDDLVLLNELHLGGCTKLNLSTLPTLPSLSVLHLEHTDVDDLTVLTAQPALRTVTVSADMLPLILPEDAAFTVRLVP